MGIAAITPHTLTLLAGDEQRIRHGGAEIVVWEIQGGSKVNISLDGQADLPAAAGRGFRQQHTYAIIKNPNATTVIVTILQSTEPGSFIDNLDTATNVSINGDVQAVNSPHTDEGGSISPTGQSVAGGSFTAGEDFVTAAENTSGLFVRSAHLFVFGNAGNNNVSRFVAGNRNLCQVNDNYPKDKLDTGDVYVPPGERLRVAVATGATVNGQITYDIL